MIENETVFPKVSDNRYQMLKEVKPLNQTNVDNLHRQLLKREWKFLKLSMYVYTYILGHWLLKSCLYNIYKHTLHTYIIIRKNNTQK